MAAKCNDLHEKVGAHGEKLETHEGFLEDLRDDVKDLKRYGLMLLLLNLGVTSFKDISPTEIAVSVMESNHIALAFITNLFV